MLTDLGMNIPANGPFVISQVLNKGKNPKASKAYWRFAPRLGRRVAQGMLSLGHAARRGRTPGGLQDSDSHSQELVLSISFPPTN